MSKLQTETFHNEDLKLHLLRLEQIENKSFNNGRAGVILPTYVCCAHFKFLFRDPLSEEDNLTILAQ